MKQKNPLIQLLKGEITLSVFLQGWVLIFRHILRKPLWLMMGVLLGMLGGLLYHWQFPLKHRATVLLGMEEEKATGWEGLMAQFGLEVGGTHLGEFGWNYRFASKVDVGLGADIVLGEYIGGTFKLTLGYLL